jgi:hypothetical protein
MRQLVEFLKHIHRRNTKKEYYRMAFFAKLHKAEIAPLDEVLGVTSESTRSEFDDYTNKELEERALALLRERRAMANVR